MKNFLWVVVISMFSLMGKAQNLKDRNAVKEVVLSFQEDFNEGSFKNAAAYSTLDWRHINPVGGIEKGRENVLADVRAVHKTFLKGVTMKIENIEIRFVTSHAAIADVIHQVDRYTTPDGVTHENERQIKTYVIIKKKRKWLLTQDHNTVIRTSNKATN
jgi:uncharacterized protein (TIGR02246 family)